MFQMLLSRQCSQHCRALVNENERDAKFEKSDFKNKPQVLYFIHCKSLLIYWEFEPHSTSSELSQEWVSVNLEGVVWLKIHSRNSLEAFRENIS